jgi:hypothetical protein
VGVNFGLILNSSSSGILFGEGTVGGLVGENQSVIQSSLSDISIQTRSVLAVGGLVGLNNQSGLITNSTAKGKISIQKFSKALPSADIRGDSIPFGGLVGFNDMSVVGSNAEVEICGTFEGMPTLYQKTLKANRNALIGENRSMQNSQGTGSIEDHCKTP